MDNTILLKLFSLFESDGWTDRVILPFPHRVRAADKNLMHKMISLIMIIQTLTITWDLLKVILHSNLRVNVPENQKSGKLKKNRFPPYLAH